MVHTRFTHFIFALRLMLAVVMAATATAAAATPLAADSAKAKKQRTVYIGGTAKDSFTKVALKAHITVMDTDSAVVDTTTSWKWDRDAGWTCKVPAKAGTYIIKGECEGYETTYSNFTIRTVARNRWFYVPPLLLRKKADDVAGDMELEGVVVTGTKIKMTYKGDTIVYNASAFNLPDGSMLDALVRQMPGAELKSNGDIYINGKKIDYLTLNGTDFFKGNNKVMLENLPYYTVKDLRVYNKQTEKSQLVGRDVEKRDYVMDVNLKREYNRGYIANAEAAGGTKERWLGRLFGLYYDDHTRLSVFANANNVNETRTPGTDGDWEPANMPEGQTVTRQVGFHLDTEDKDKLLRENADATATWTSATNDTRSASEQFATGGNIFRRTAVHERQSDFRLEAQNSLRYTPRSKRLNIMAWTDLAYADGHDASATRSATYDSDPTAYGDITSVLDSTFAAGGDALHQMLTNRTARTTLRKYRTLRLRQYTYGFYKLPWGDLLHFDLDGTYNFTKPSDTYSLSANEYMKEGTTDVRNIYTDGHTSSYWYHADLRYEVMLTSRFSLQAFAGYRQELQSTNSLSYRLDRLGAQWASPTGGRTGYLPSTRDSLLLAFDADNSSRYSDLTRTYNTRLVLNYESDDCYFQFSLPLDFKHERLSYHQAALDTVATRHNALFMPSLYFTKFNERIDLSASYNMSVSLPQLASLMPVSNTLNPLAKRISNPDLKSSTNHSVNADLRLKRKKHQQAFSLNAGASISANSIGTRTSYDRATGAYTYMSDNVSGGNWSVNSSLGFTRTLDKADRLTLDTRTSYEYNRNTDFDIAYTADQASVLSRVNTSRMGEKLSLRYQKGDVTATVGGNLTWRHSTGDRQNFTTINAFDYDYGASLTCRLPLAITLATDLRQYSRRGYGEESMNTDNLVWNASLTRSFCKGHIVVSAQAFDLLHRLSSTSYTVNAQGRTEVWHNTIPSYGMLHLTYKFSKMPKGKK